MSKEKNLTKLDANNEVITECHNVFRDRVTYITKYPYGRYDMVVGYGPAIDRLYEFEKLGLEPEEIESLQKRHEDLKGVRSANVVLIETNNDLFREIGKLREENQRQAENIVGLQGYIKALEEDCEYFKGERNDAFEEVKRLKKRHEELKGVRSSNVLLIETNSDLFREIKELRSMNQKQYENIEELQKEIDEREQVQLASYREIGKLRELVRLQKEAINKYVDEEEVYE